MSKSVETQDTTEGERLAELGKRRGFFFPSFESYGGVSGLYTYGPRGAALKRHLEEVWRDRFTVKEGNFEVEGPTVTPKAVLDASGHTDDFDDMLVVCASCDERNRADHLIEDNTDIEDAETVSIPEVEALIREHDIVCPTCGADLAGQPVEEFNLMFETAIGPGDGTQGFLRPETAQSIFVEFPRLIEYARNELPFGATQIGPGYRNEISPRRGLVRVREFTMAELELFIDPERNEPDLSEVRSVEVRLYPGEEQEQEGTTYVDTTIGEAVDDGTIGNPWVAYYLGIARRWFERIGLDMDRFRFRQHLPGERAHYATDCWDAEAEIDGDWIEITGFAHRGCYDLKKHQEHSAEEYTVFVPYDEPVEEERATVDPDMGFLGPEFGGAAPDIADALERLATEEPEAFDDEVVEAHVGGEQFQIPRERTGFAVEVVRETGEHVLPEVVEPSFGIGRIVYTILGHNLQSDEIDGERRTYLSLPPEIAPTTVSVFPLMDRDGLGDMAREIEDALREAGLDATYDDTGNIGRRYRRQDEIGTPFCVTVDYDSLEDGTVTIRDRDTTEQIRVDADDVPTAMRDLLAGSTSLSEL